MSFLGNQNVQFEVSNPQYYPDDSAPPVPNISISTLEEEQGAKYIKDSDVVSLVDTHYPTYAQKNPNAFMHMAGTPNTKEFDSDSGITTTTGDHLFYSRLNVESYIPPFNVMDDNSIETYYRELAPAVCGLHNYTNTGRAIPVAHIHQAHNFHNSFAIQGVSNAPMALTNSTANSDTENRMFFSSQSFSNYSARSHNFDVVDYVLRIQKKHLFNQIGSAAVQLQFSEFTVEFRVESDNVNHDYGHLNLYGHYWFYDLSSTSEGADRTLIEDSDIISVTLSDVDSAIPAEGDFVYVIVRTNLKQGLGGEQYSVTDSTNYRSFTYGSQLNWPTTQYTLQNAVIIRDRYSADYNIPLSMQILGYENSQDVPSSLVQFMSDSTYPSPHEYYYPIAGSVVDSGGFVIPGFTGNMWEHVNKVATVTPFQRKVT